MLSLQKSKRYTWGVGRPFNKTGFNNPARLAQMLALRYGDPPWSYNQLGVHYGVDHSTIVYHVQKAKRLGLTPTHLTPTVPYMRRNAPAYHRVAVIGPTTSVVLLLGAAPSPKPKPAEKYAHLIYDECVAVNPGKNYREYRREARKRRAGVSTETTLRLKAEFEERVRQRGRLHVPRLRRPQ